MSVDTAVLFLGLSLAFPITMATCRGASEGILQWPSMSVLTVHSGAKK